MHPVMMDQNTDYGWPASDITMPDPDWTSQDFVSVDDEHCVGPGGHDVFPYGLLLNETQGFEVRSTSKRFQPISQTKRRPACCSLKPASWRESFLLLTPGLAQH